MKRNCRYVPLSKQPLALVLAQIRFSVIRQMEEYIPAIQESFRRRGFPLEQAGKVRQVIFGLDGDNPVQVVEQQRWEYRTKDKTSSVIVMQDSVILQTTSYKKFEAFADELLHAVQNVLNETEHDQLGVIERVGLRYVNVVQPREREDFRFYLRPGFHGVADEVFKTGTPRLYVESTGKTSVADDSGTMVVRVIQNDQGFSLPPDLLGAAPVHVPRATAGELITLVDMDHYIEGTFEPSADWIVAKAYELHDHLIETFHNHVVTQNAIEVWK